MSWKQCADPTEAVAKRLPYCRLPGGNVYIHVPPTFIYVTHMRDSVYAVCSSGPMRDVPIAPDDDAEAIAERVWAEIDDDPDDRVDDLFRLTIGHFFRNDWTAPDWAGDDALEFTGPELRQFGTRVASTAVRILTDRAAKRGVDPLSPDDVALVLPHIERVCRLFDAPDAAVRAMQTQVVRSIRPVMWLDDGRWVTEGLGGMFAVGSAATVEEALVQLTHARTPQAIEDESSHIAWIGPMGERLIKTVAREPLTTQLRKMVDRSGFVPDGDWPLDQAFEKMSEANQGRVPTDRLMDCCVRCVDAGPPGHALAGQMLADIAELILQGKPLKETQSRMQSWLLMTDSSTDPKDLELVSHQVATSTSVCDARTLVNMMREIRDLQRRSVELQEEAAAKAEEVAAKAAARAEEAEAKASAERAELLESNHQMVEELQVLKEGAGGGHERQINERLDELMAVVTAQQQQQQEVRGTFADRIEYDLRRHDWTMTAAELRQLFQDHPDATMANESKRAKALGDLGVPRKRTRTQKGWMCIRPLV